MLFQILLLNLVITVVSILSTLIISEPIPWRELLLLHLAFLLCQIEVASICFCISAFMHNSSLGIGIAVPLGFYFLNIICNISSEARALKYITPYSYCEAADIISSGSLSTSYIIVGMALAAVCLAAAFIYYPKKDLRP